jgi:CubicO group peptidase (beta-lactamase class C family)
MDHIGPDDVYAIIPHRARGYRLNAGKELENCSLADTSNKIPSGGMISTATDLVNFALALNEGKLLRRDTVRLMFTPQKTRAGKSFGYGMGWGIATIAEHPIATHSGGQQGISTDLILFPNEDLAVAVMVNRESAPAVDLAGAIARIVARLPAQAARRGS